MRKHPQLLLQVIPDSKNDKQRIHLPDHRSKNKGSFSVLPNSTKNKGKGRRFRTLERKDTKPSAYSGPLRIKGNKKLKRDSSPAVPIPTHSRLSSYSNKIKPFESSITSDFKMVSQGLNFEVEPMERKNHMSKSSLSHKRK